MQKIYHARQPFDVLSFHRIMWDDQITTEADKSRWVSQGIDVRRDMTTDDSMMMTDHDATTTTTTATTTAAATTTTTMLDFVSATHLPWGLVQHHGGPCGVLAAIQAEMLRMLVFDNNTEDIPESPDMFVAPTATRTQDLLTGDKVVVTTALARSIALILARATLTPSAVDANNNNSRQVHSNCVQIVLPINHHNNTNNTDETSLTWQDLEPWHPTATTASNKNSSTALTVFSIPISESDDDDDDDDDNNNNNNSPHDGSSATANRQKTQESGCSNDSLLTSRIHRLSRIVEAFLLDTSTSS